jgi:hypothetical protein
MGVKVSKSLALFTITSKNSVALTDAVKYVNQKQEQIDTLKKIDERIEAIEEETTTNGVF